MINEQEARERMGKNYIKVWFMFEALSAKAETVIESLGNHVKNLEKNKKVLLYKKEELPEKLIENPPIKGVTEAWSKIIETELFVKDLEDLVSLIIEYGPSAIEIIEPNELKVTIGQAQSTVNLIAEMMHRFAAAGIGGILLAKGK